jgi:hypothetical protein
MYGDSWGCRPLSEIKALYDDLLDKLPRKPYGPYDALSLLIGQKNASVFCKRMGYPIH